MAEHEPMEPLPTDLARLFEAERHRPPPSEHSKQHVWNGVKDTVASSRSSGDPTQARLGDAARLAKLGRTLLVFAAGAASGAVVHSVLSETPGPATEVAQVAPPPPNEPTLTTPEAAPPSVPERGPTRVARREMEPPPSPPAAPSADEQLAAERALIEQARTALARGRVADARAVLSKHATEFPAGQLQEEREALTILSLAASAQLDEARKLAADFRNSHPKSILLPTIDRRLSTK